MGVDDSLIVDELKKGSNTGIRLMVNKYQSKLYHWGKRHYDVLNDHDVREIVDDTFLRVLDGIDSFQLRSEKAFRSWILRIFTNLAIDCLRKRKRLFDHFREESYEDHTSNGVHGSFPCINRELDRKIYHDYLSPPAAEHPLAPAVRAFLDGLQENDRVILLSCAGGVPHREVAQMTGIPKEHVKVYYYRLKERLKKHLIALIDE